MMQMNAGGHPLSIAAIKWTILQQGVREPTGVAIPSRGTRAIPGVVLDKSVVKLVKLVYQVVACA